MLTGNELRGNNRTVCSNYNKKWEQRLCGSINTHTNVSMNKETTVSHTSTRLKTHTLKYRDVHRGSHAEQHRLFKQLFQV